MEALPVEILTKIFSYLEFHDILTVSEVSKSFGSIINVPVLVGRITANFTEFEIFQNSSRRYLNGKVVNGCDHNLEKLVEISRINFDCVSAVTSLKCDNIDLLSHDLFRCFIKCFPALTELHLEGIYLQEPPKKHFKCISLPKLKTLSFLYSSNELLTLFTDVKGSLETLKICFVPHGNDDVKKRNFEMVKTILQNNSTTLQKLNMYDANFDESFLDLISSIKFKNFRNCSISFSSYLPLVSSGFEKFIKSNAKTLEKFKIRTFDHINKQHLQILVDNAVNIKSLSLIVCSKCDYNGFNDFRGLKHLERLKIHPTHICEGIGPSFDSFVATKVLHRNEKVLTLELGTIKVTQEVVQKIIFCFPNLTTLCLTPSSKIKPDLTEMLKNELKNLRKLETV